MAHLYTQWGAKAAPKIMVEIDGEEEQLFGWETDASGSAYREFLKQFIPHLINWIEENDWKDQTFFHTSDEPTMENITSYAQASQFLRQLIGDIPVIDALSDYDFYQENLVDIPIPASDHIEPFIENKIRPLWVYYCVSQNKKVSNRFFDMPSYRNRIIGYQLYKYDIQGFLHWGYNFYFTQFSKQAVDPFTETDAGGNFSSGDSFLVYPGKDQPLPSIRLKVFNEALQDLRVLHLLESYIGKEAVIELLEKNIEPLTFSNYPRNSQWQLKIKRVVYDRLQFYIPK
ncbi:DUF4091 domain-containing protein [Jeotgalibaca sp. MA1X17-3]|nr:DUF4091 domain-containing protein [Jeotgalibaca sp. MA1X17-3]UJF15625.1 DUF4091 domain-containing protein [Jeotgalibaca sp. MA1X17-3]